jgi:hypothetical protein
MFPYLYCKVLDLRTATPRGEVSMTRLLGSREMGAHPELQLGLRLEIPGEQPPQESLTQGQHNRWDKFSCSPKGTVRYWICGQQHPVER